jgi:hypothetical protein
LAVLAIRYSPAYAAVGLTVLLVSHAFAAHGFGGRRLDIREGREVVARATA